MKLTVLVVGKVRGPLADAVADFEARAGRYWTLEVVEVDAGAPGGKGSRPEDVQRSEGERIRARLPDRGDVWALSRKGKPISSEELARVLGDRALEASPGVTFLVGGAFGLAPELVRAADRRVSLSSLTLPHQIARLVLAEQLYRAGTILRNEPYHKGTGN